MIPKYRQLVEKLQKATEDRTISWESTSGSNEYQTMIGENSISIKYHEKLEFIVDPTETTHVSLLLWNKKGQNIDEVKEDKGNLDFKQLYNLYESARRAYSKVDETLDEVLAHLG